MPATNASSYQMNGDTPGIFPNGPTGAPTMGDPVQGARLVTIQATAVASQDFPIALPLGARVIAVTVLQNVAPTGVTPAMQIGTTVGGSDIVPSTAVTATQNVVPLALNAARPLVVVNFASIVASSAGGSVISLRYTQTTPTAVGTFTVFIEYVMA